MASTKTFNQIVRYKRYPVPSKLLNLPIQRATSTSLHSTPPAATDSSSSSNNEKILEDEHEHAPASPSASDAKKPEKKKTMAELDDELRLKLEQMDREGGEAGLELEDGRPAAMKRGVRENMFRLI